MITILTEQYQSRVETNPLNIIKTGFIFLTWIVLSIHIELIAPTMTVLAKNVNVTYDGMGTVLASRDAGYLIASILGAVLQNIVEKYSDGILIFAFILSAIVTFVTPFLRSVILLCVLFVIQGIAEGFTELGGTSLILFMWKEKSAAPLNIIHFGYGIGAIIINLVVQPFLKKDISTGHSNIIIIPYIITAMLCALIAVGYVVFFIKALRNRRERIEIRIDTNEENSSFAYLPRICGHGYFGYGLTLSMIFILSLFCITGNDQTFSKFFFTFLKLDKFKTTPGVATWGISLYWLSYSVGQLIIAIVSVFVSVEICLNTVWFGALCVAIAWLIFKCIIGLTGTSLIILGTLTGLVISPINPLTFALFNQRLNVVPILLSLVLCGSALGGIVFEKLAGFIMDHNPNHFPTLLILGIAVSICLYLIANIIYVFHRHKPSSQSLNQRKETIVFLLDDAGKTIYAIDEVNQRTLVTSLTATLGNETSYVFGHFPYAPSNSPQAKNYVELKKITSPSACSFTIHIGITFSECLDKNLGVSYSPQTPQIVLNQSQDVQVWLEAPPHRINGNHTVIVQWKAFDCLDYFTWTPKELSFNGLNYEQKQRLTITRMKNGPVGELFPIFNGGGYALIDGRLYQIYIE